MAKKRKPRVTRPRQARKSGEFLEARKDKLEKYIVDELHRYMRINKKNEKDLRYIG